MATPDTEELQRARQAAWRLLARRARSISELKDKLTERRFSSAVIRLTIEHLTSLGYLDDEAFARGRARYLMENRPMGRRRLTWELTQKGVEKALAEAAVEEAWEGRSERSVALSLAKRRLETYRGVPKVKAKRRLQGYLERRGFGLDVIIPLLRELFPD